LDDNGNSIPVKGRGHYFNSSASVSVNSDTLMKFHHSFSLMTWIKVPSIFTERQSIVSRSAAGTPTQDVLDFFLVSNGAVARLGLELSNNGSPFFSDTHSTVPTSEWAWLTVVVDDHNGNEVIFSINNNAKAAVSTDGQFIRETQSSELNIGMKFNPSLNTFVASQYLSAYIYELKIYNVAKDSLQSAAYVLSTT